MKVLIPSLVYERIEPITKGWSVDKKYIVYTAQGKQLLRISPLDRAAYIKQMFETMQQLAPHISMSTPITYGHCSDGVHMYSLYHWCEGEDAAHVLPTLPEEEQYRLGYTSGDMLRVMHHIEAPAHAEDWAQRFTRKALHKIELYEKCGLTFPYAEQMIAYIHAHLPALAGRPQSFHHGDYHVGNMVISQQLQLFILDFERSDVGDPWEEFNRIVWTAAASERFATGQLHGYFQGEPPALFFELLALYIYSNTLSSVAWAISYGGDEVETMLQQAAQVADMYAQVTTVKPSWYTTANSN